MSFAALKDGDTDCEFQGDSPELVRNYKNQKMELIRMRKAMEELKEENRLKTKECQDALKSLQELQNELMRKSMHVGSLGKKEKIVPSVFKSKKIFSQLFMHIY